MATVTVKGYTSNAKVTVTVAGFTGVTAVSVTRVHPDGTESVLRSGASLTLTNGGATIDDYEMPMDVAVTYRADQVTPTGSMTATSPGITIVAEQNRSFLKDPATPSRNVRLDYIENIASTTRASRAGVFDIVDRANPIVVSAARHGWTGDLTFWTYTTAERQAVEKLIAPGRVLLLSTPLAYGVGNEYVSVSDAQCDRLDTIGSEQIRHWTLPLTAVDRPATLPTMPPNTRWVDVRNTYATWADLYATGKTWRQLLEGT